MPARTPSASRVLVLTLLASSAPALAAATPSASSAVVTGSVPGTPRATTGTRAPGAPTSGAVVQGSSRPSR